MPARATRHRRRKNHAPPARPNPHPRRRALAPLSKQKPAAPSPSFRAAHRLGRRIQPHAAQRRRATRFRPDPPGASATPVRPEPRTTLAVSTMPWRKHVDTRSSGDSPDAGAGKVDSIPATSRSMRCRAAVVSPQALTAWPSSARPTASDEFLVVKGLARDSRSSAEPKGFEHDLLIRRGRQHDHGAGPGCISRIQCQDLDPVDIGQPDVENHRPRPSSDRIRGSQCRLAPSSDRFDVESRPPSGFHRSLRERRPRHPRSRLGSRDSLMFPHPSFESPRPTSDRLSHVLELQSPVSNPATARHASLTAHRMKCDRSWSSSNSPSRFRYERLVDRRPSAHSMIRRIETQSVFEEIAPSRCGVAGPRCRRIRSLTDAATSAIAAMPVFLEDEVRSTPSRAVQSIAERANSSARSGSESRSSRDRGSSAPLESENVPAAQESGPRASRDGTRPRPRREYGRSKRVRVSSAPSIPRRSAGGLVARLPSRRPVPVAHRSRRRPCRSRR